MEAPNECLEPEQHSMVSNSSELIIDDCNNLINENVFLDQTGTSAAQVPFIAATNEPVKRGISLVSTVEANNCDIQDNCSIEPLPNQQTHNWMMNFETPEKQSNNHPPFHSIAKRASLYSPSPISLQSSHAKPTTSNADQMGELMEQLAQKVC